MYEFHLNNLQLQDFQLFLAVGRYGSFTRAAERMHVTQSWVSKRMNLMESELGLHLFLRGSRRMELTPAGKLLQERLESINQSLTEAITTAHQVQTGVSGFLRIGFLEWAVTTLFVPIQRFIRDNPQISVDILCQQFQDLRASLESGYTDLILTMEYDNTSFLKDSIHSARVREVPMMAYISCHNPLAKRDTLTIRDLQAEPMLLLDPRCSLGYTDYIGWLFHQNGIRPLIAQYAPNGRAHMANILLNRGILIASSYFLENEFHKEIHAVPLEGVSTHITAVWQKDNQNPILPAFLQKLMEDTE